MNKKQPKKSKQNPDPLKKQAETGKKLQGWVMPVVFLVLGVILLSFMTREVMFGNKVPKGVDNLGNIGRYHQLNEFHNESGDVALWNPYIFGGMPRYHGVAATDWTPDRILNRLSGLNNRYFIFYLFGAIGMFLLMRLLGTSQVVAFAGALMFVLVPHYRSLWLEGHNTKFAALMVLPWVILSFKYLTRKQNLLAAAFFALAFGTQIRTVHYQIVLYTGFIILAIGLPVYIGYLLKGRYAYFLRSTGLLIFSLVFAFLLSAQPFFLSREYMPYSKRGSSTISLAQEEQQQKREGSGVRMEYATQWSMQPKELFTLVIPHAYGGLSAVEYDGKEYPHLKGRMIPGYWGSMPFTQSYEYLGLVIAILAVIALLYYRRNRRLIISLSAALLILTLLAFGKYFQSYYSLFYDYFPYFNKLRTPAMSLTVVFFILTVFASLGLQALMDRYASMSKAEKRNVYYVFGGFAALGILAALSWSSSSYTKQGESYQGEELMIITAIREELFWKDLYRYFLFLALAFVAVFLFLRKSFKPLYFGWLIIALIAIDVIPVSLKSEKEFVNRSTLERQEFRQTSTDSFILGDDDLFRVFPVGNLFQDNRWAYFHQTLGGYSPIKMVNIEELIENNIYNGWDAQLPLNWNVLKFMNVKYVVIEGMVNTPYLTPVHQDQENKWITYRFNEEMPRAFFVDDFEVIKDPYDRLRRINDPEFDAATTAILTKEPVVEVNSPDSSMVSVESFNPNHVAFEVYTNKQALLVVSENYYPPGWNITLDGEPVEAVYQTDHSIQSIVVPEGKHEVSFTFHPRSVTITHTVVKASLGILYLIVLLSLLIPYLKRKKADKAA